MILNSAHLGELIGVFAFSVSTPAPDRHFSRRRDIENGAMRNATIYDSAQQIWRFHLKSAANSEEDLTTETQRAQRKKREKKEPCEMPSAK
jgi:hypothetical protein